MNDLFGDLVKALARATGQSSIFTGQSSTSVVEPPANRWLTATGDTVEVFSARPGPGNPQKSYWRVLAPNGKQVASSGHGFNRPRSARRAARRMFPEATP